MRIASRLIDYTLTLTETIHVISNFFWHFNESIKRHMLSDMFQQMSASSLYIITDDCIVRMWDWEQSSILYITYKWLLFKTKMIHTINYYPLDYLLNYHTYYDAHGKKCYFIGEGNHDIYESRKIDFVYCLLDGNDISDIVAGLHTDVTVNNLCTVLRSILKVDVRDHVLKIMTTHDFQEHIFKATDIIKV